MTRLAKSAPAKPGVWVAIALRLTSSPIWTRWAYICKIANLPAKSGRSTKTWRSKRPGRNKAASRVSGRLVAAKTMTTASLGLKPSISVKSWFKVCSRSSLLPLVPDPELLDLPIASNSSIKMMLGAFFFAWANRSRTRAAPVPTNNSTNSEAEMLKKVTPASPATAFAKRVFPVPGGPTKRTPLGIRAPILLKRSASLRNSTISFNSVFASSAPATSLKVIGYFSPSP